MSGVRLAGVVPAGARAARDCRNDAGLVSISTSSTVEDGTLWLRCDPVQSRLKRMRRKVDQAAYVLGRSACGQNFGRPRCRALFLTLTYRDVDGWRPHHLADFVKVVRMWFSRRGERLRNVWVAELQERGAVHYHMVVWVPRHLRLPSPDKRGWWPHGMTNLQRARSAVAYLTKYTSKGDAGQFPRGLRLHGSSGLDAESRREVRWFCAPGWVRDAFSSLSDVRRVVGGWVDAATGEFLRSPWRVWRPGGGVVWIFKSVEVSPCVS